MIKKIIKILTVFISIVLLSLPIEIKSLSKVSGTIAAPENIISEYDRLFQKVAYETGVDWHLLSAIAYKESRYQQGLKSHRGAVGLMQIMPTTAKHFNIPFEHLDDPLLNVIVSAKLIKEIEKSFNFRNAPERERMKIILAGYNSGIGNLFEARKMASEAGVDCNNWEQLKVYGKINNPQTREFVSGVMKKYDEYQVMTASSN